MIQPSAKIIADSVTEDGDRLTTLEVVFHRFVLAEINTHRTFSRNSASSRAIPTHKQITQVLYDPALPLEFGTKKPGMQADTPLEGEDALLAKEIWLEAANAAITAAKQLDRLQVHKQVSNRLLEPFLWHTAIISSTEWGNFFDQRISELAQPEIAAPAELMKEAIEASEPQLVKHGEWHLPYIQDDEQDLDKETKIKVAVARCARVSYLTHDGKRSISKDLELYQNLITANPPHMSPLEHVATPTLKCVYPGGFKGNFEGWEQLRHLPLTRELT